MKNKIKKKTICFSVDEETFEKLDCLSKETGARKSELMRRAIKKLQDGGMDEALLMLCVVQTRQVINEMDEEKDPEHIKELKRLTANIMRIKGGNGDGSV